MVFVNRVFIMYKDVKEKKPGTSENKRKSTNKWKDQHNYTEELEEREAGGASQRSGEAGSARLRLPEADGRGKHLASKDVAKERGRGQETQ